MDRRRPFAVEISGSAISGKLHWPHLRDEAGPAAVVLLCNGLLDTNKKTEVLCARIIESLTQAGLAVAEYSARRSDLPVQSNHQHSTAQMIDDASAVFRWLMLRDELDLTRVGVLGYSFGAIVAACLARRTDQIARLCLLAPVPATVVLSAAQRTDRSALLTALGLEGVTEGFFTDLGTLDPMHDAAVHDRPTLILHGAADDDVRPELSFAYSDAIELADHEAQHTLVAHADHFFEDDPSRTACLAQVSEFFGAMRDGSNPKNGT